MVWEVKFQAKMLYKRHKSAKIEGVIVLQKIIA
jgi:hypothetical protein